MKNIIKFEWQRMIRSYSFYISLIIAAIVVILDAQSKYEIFKQGLDVNVSVFEKWIGIYIGFDESIFLFTLLPLLTSFAYSWTVGADRSSGYITQVITRTSRKKYFFAKYIVSFMSGGIVFSFAILLHFFIISTFYPAIYSIVALGTSPVSPSSFCPELFYTHPVLFLLVWTGVSFLWGGAMVCIALGVGMIARKYTFSVIAPFLVFTVQQIIGTYINVRYSILINGHNMSTVWTGMLYAAPLSSNYASHLLINIAVIIIIPSIIFAVRGRKYECL